jgi:hypothetical protein
MTLVIGKAPCHTCGNDSGCDSVDKGVGVKVRKDAEEASPHMR